MRMKYELTSVFFVVVQQTITIVAHSGALHTFLPSCPAGYTAATHSAAFCSNIENEFHLDFSSPVLQVHYQESYPLHA
jgi:hypothetical protein